MNLTQDEIERYAPYHTMEAFQWGFEDWMSGEIKEFDAVLGQAYDRGAECAARWQQADWRNDPLIKAGTAHAAPYYPHQIGRIAFKRRQREEG